MRIVLDTNCLIQILPKRSKYHYIWECILSGDVILCISNEIIEEYTEILHKLTDTYTAELVITTILENPHVEFYSPFYRFELIALDKDDNKFADCAIASSSNFIITNDHHYDVLKKIDFPHVVVLSLDEFYTTLTN